MRLCCRVTESIARWKCEWKHSMQKFQIFQVTANTNSILLIGKGAAKGFPVDSHRTEWCGNSWSKSVAHSHCDNTLMVKSSAASWKFNTSPSAILQPNWDVSDQTSIVQRELWQIFLNLRDWIHLKGHQDTKKKGKLTWLQCFQCSARELATAASQPRTDTYFSQRVTACLARTKSCCSVKLFCGLNACSCTCKPHKPCELHGCCVKTEFLLFMNRRACEPHEPLSTTPSLKELQSKMSTNGFPCLTARCTPSAMAEHAAARLWMESTNSPCTIICVDARDETTMSGDTISRLIKVKVKESATPHQMKKSHLPTFGLLNKHPKLALFGE